MPKKSRSPLKAKPLRNPGQSLDDAISDAFIDLLPWFLLPVLLVMFAALEWFREWRGSSPSPDLAAGIAAISIVISFFVIRQRIKNLSQLKLGRDGERAVGQFLEGLRASGWQVFHDIPGDNFNIDHVAVGPGGVYTIETKTWSKPMRGNAEIRVREDHLDANGLKPSRDPFTQVKAQARWLSTVLQESTGRKIGVNSVLVFPGWFIRDERQRGSSPWVLEPKALPKWLENESSRLKREDISLIAFHLSRYIRKSLEIA